MFRPLQLNPPFWASEQVLLQLAGLENEGASPQPFATACCAKSADVRNDAMPVTFMVDADADADAMIFERWKMRCPFSVPSRDASIRTNVGTKD